jgi:hypothetical protein
MNARTVHFVRRTFVRLRDHQFLPALQREAAERMEAILVEVIPVG